MREAAETTHERSHDDGTGKRRLVGGGERVARPGE
jgi:hypothetical protein